MFYFCARGAFPIGAMETKVLLRMLKEPFLPCQLQISNLDSILRFLTS